MESRIPDRIKENLPDSVAIVGVGGIGSWVSFMMGQINEVERIGLFDEDRIEESNIERTPFSYDDLTKKKSETMKEYIKNRSQGKEVIAYDHLDETNEKLLNLYDLVIVCADSGVVRNQVLEAHENSISAGYDIDEEKDWISVSEQSMWFAEDDEDDGYTIEPSWSGPAMQGAVIVMTSILNDQRPADISSRMDDFYKSVEDSEGRKVYDCYGEVEDPEQLIEEHEERVREQTSSSDDLPDEDVPTSDESSGEGEPWTFNNNSTIELVTDEETISFDGGLTIEGDHNSVSELVEEEFGDVASVITEEDLRNYLNRNEYQRNFEYPVQAYEVIETDRLTEIPCPFCGTTTLDENVDFVFCRDENCEYEQLKEEFSTRLVEDEYIPNYVRDCPECNERRIIRKDNFHDVDVDVPDEIENIYGCLECGHIDEVNLRSD